MARAYYNEINPEAAAWLRELIKAGHIANGEVDERSIVDVRAGDLAGFTQCHFFAGIGVWSYALRRAGWDDTRPVWTGSCPCQPFSSSGKKKGFSDERHLWPDFFRLIRECRPDVCLGEQVASPDGLHWLDTVHADLEGAGYAVGAVDTCAAGVGAPHIRQRLYWVADTLRAGFRGRGASEARDESGSIKRFAGLRETCELGDSASGGCGELGDASLARSIGHADGSDETRRLGDTDSAGPQPRREATSIDGHRSSAIADGAPCRLADSDARGLEVGRTEGACRDASGDCRRSTDERIGNSTAEHRAPRAAGPTNGLWRDADWLFCTDGKWRPVEPGTFPLAHGAPARVGRLRGYGNAINAEQATAFIEAYLDVAASSSNERGVA